EGSPARRRAGGHPPGGTAGARRLLPDPRRRAPIDLVPAREECPSENRSDRLEGAAGLSAGSGRNGPWGSHGDRRRADSRRVLAPAPPGERDSPRERHRAALATGRKRIAPRSPDPGAVAVSETAHFAAGGGAPVGRRLAH